MLLALLHGIKVVSNFDLGHARKLNSSKVRWIKAAFNNLSALLQQPFKNFNCYRKTLKFLMLDFSESPKFSMFQ